MKNLRKNKKFVLGASVALTALMLAAATFAWFSAQDSVDNNFSTGGIPDGSVKVWEIFDKEDPWNPGEEVNKDVAVANFGEEPLFVRATFKEYQSRMEAEGVNLKVTSLDAKVTDFTTGAYKPVPVIDYATAAGWKEASAAGYTFTTPLPAGVTMYVREDTAVAGGPAKVSYAVTTNYGADLGNGRVSGTFVLDDTAKTITASAIKYDYYTKDTAASGTKVWSETAFPTNPNVSALDSLITFKFHEADLTSTANDTWYYNAEDGWFYLIGVVEGGTVSPMLLDSVTLDGAANNTYQYMDYTLTVNVEGLQATEKALADWNLAAGNKVYDALKVHAIPEK